MRKILVVALALFIFAGSCTKDDPFKNKIVIALNREKAPITVKNFLSYCENGFYNGTIFHRVIADFMIQGGGLTADMKKKETRDPIKNEADNGLKNNRGTIAMARIPDPHSATAQFFINVKNNDKLNFTEKTPKGWGYCVFGKIVDGMDIVDSIRYTNVTERNNRANVPVSPISIIATKVDGDKVTFGIQFSSKDK